MKGCLAFISCQHCHLRSCQVWLLVLSVWILYALTVSAVLFSPVSCHSPKTYYIALQSTGGSKLPLGVRVNGVFPSCDKSLFSTNLLQEFKKLLKTQFTHSLKLMCWVLKPEQHLMHRLNATRINPVSVCFECLMSTNLLLVSVMITHNTTWRKIKALIIKNVCVNILNLNSFNSSGVCGNCISWCLCWQTDWQMKSP